jgi:putative heme-binding domain-containing protein
LSRFRECLEGGDADAGRLIFTTKPEAGCIRCHTVSGEGGKIGPELTWLRNAMDRVLILESIVVPNSVIAPGFGSAAVMLKNGEEISGVVSRKSQSEFTITSIVDGKQRAVKVADFGTSRFIEIAAHGTTVIGSPPYMAPEQFHGKAVFASDIYSLGVTMYQMLTGVMPYQTPAPADLEKLMRGELITPPRSRNAKIPAKINDIVMKAVAPDVKNRYQNAGDLLSDLLTARSRKTPSTIARQTPRTPPLAASSSEDVQDIHTRLRARETPQPRFCWHCRKPLHARSARCPFCGEAQ